MGEKIEYKQKNIRFEGHVFQFRINAENPSNKFMPSPGLLEYYIPPGGPNVRVDSACYSGYRIPPHYDSLIAKLIVKGKNREDAMRIAKRALKEFHVGGVDSTVPFHQYMLDNETFKSGEYNLNFIDGLIEEGCIFTNDEPKTHSELVSTD